MRPLLALLAALLLAFPVAAQAATPRLELVGALHAHSAYSDGWPGSRPADFFASARAQGADFLGSSDHSTNLGITATFSEGCVGPLLPRCAVADDVNPADAARKWDATLEQAAAATDGTFAAFRGFEWTSDRFGHINVFFSRAYTNEATAAGYATMDGFWDWFTRSPAQGGGADGLGTFNHPSAKKIDLTAGSTNWDDFRYVPAADERMVGIEVFNEGRDYGSRDDFPGGAYAHALDKGWHVGAIGAEDLGHREEDVWGTPDVAKTVVQATARTPQAIRAALLDRRFSALGPGEARRLRLDLTVDGEPMGARLQRPAGAPVRIASRATDPSVTLELVTRGGAVVATGERGRLAATRKVAEGERWYFVRARRDGRPVGYTSPVWIEGARDAPAGEWLAGDGHVHTCFSHDSYCGPQDDNTGPEVLYSSGGTVAQRFTEAALKGLDFLTISDHNDVRAWDDPAFGSSGVLGVRAYEHSVRGGGHAHLLGVSKRFAEETPATDLARAVNDDDALFQINHPTYKGEAPLTGCADIAAAGSPLHWRLGFAVRPDTIEVWNPTALIPPAETFWECWLQQGWRVPATAGSDSHGGNQANLGMPTLWVLSRDRSEASVLAAIRAGRTTITRLAPNQGAARLLLEADGDRDGDFEATVGDTVAPGTPMRVRADGLSAPGTVRVRANGAALVEERLAPGGELRFAAPDAPGWVRATLVQAQGTADADPNCAQSGQSLDFCSEDLAYTAMTSPLYLERPGRPATPEPPREPEPPAPADPAAPAAPAEEDEPDDDPPLPPAEQSGGAAPLPAVGAQPSSGDARPGLTPPRLIVGVRLLRGGRRLRIRVLPAGWRHDVQVRRGPRGRWRTVAAATDAVDTIVAAPRRRALRVRVRLRLPDGRAGAWVVRRVR